MDKSHLQQLLTSWFDTMEKGSLLSAIVTSSIGVGLLVLLYFFITILMLPTVQKLVARVSPTQVFLLQPLLKKFNRRVAFLVCCVVFLAMFDTVFPVEKELGHILKELAQALIIICGGFIVSSLASIGGALYNQLDFAKEVPIQGLIQLVKLVAFIVCAILIVSLVLEKSPTYILSGFGAVAAVILLVFKDTILGFVASIQIAANRLVTHGDWIQIDKFGANGEVIDLGLNTVKVRNWDNTVTTIPTFMLVSGSFKNWRAMEVSGGRRIKRSLHIDMNSIRLADDELLQNILKDIDLYSFIDKSDLPTPVTNLGLFRRYAEGYLKQHSSINQSLTLMVRELQSTNHGLPIQFYCFSANKEWVAYEHIQAEITDHLLALLPVFALRPYQSVTGEFNTH